MSTKEGNRLIAEFMGAEYKSWKDGGKKRYRFTEPIGKTYSFTLNELSYHTSWDWLMPVVEKISNMYREYAHIPAMMDLHELTLFNPIETVYKCVIQFIQWYNQTKTHKSSALNLLVVHTIALITSKLMI